MSMPEPAQAREPFPGGVPPYLIVFFGSLIALGPLSMDAYLPAIPAMASDFGVSIVSVNNTLSLFLVAYAIGQFFGGAFSDQIGRKRIGFIGLTVYIATTFAISTVHSVEQMLALRFLQALGGGFSTVICMASVRDIYPVIELGKRFATVTMIVLVAPLVAPTLGSLLLPLGWQSIFLFKAAYALVLVVLYAMIVPETQAGAWRDISVAAIFRQCAGVLGRRVDGSLLPLRYAFAMALASSVLMNFVTNASFVYLEYFDVSPSRFPWFFGLSVLGFMSMNLYSMRRLRPENAGTLFPRGLVIQFLGVSGLAAVVLADAASLWTIVPLIVVTMSTLGLIAPAGSAQYMGFFTRLAGSASSVYTTMMFTMGGALGALTGALYDGSLLPMVAVMGAASVTANIVVLTMPRQPAEQPV